MENGLPFGDSPIDIPTDALGGSATGTSSGAVLWAGKIALISSVLLLLFNAHALKNWAEQLPVTRLSAPVITAAEHWYSLTDSWGLNVLVNKTAELAASLRAGQS
jgi:hypothetical protein